MTRTELGCGLEQKDDARPEQSKCGLENDRGSGEGGRVNESGEQSTLDKTMDIEKEHYGRARERDKEPVLDAK